MIDTATLARLTKMRNAVTQAEKELEQLRGRVAQATEELKRFGCKTLEDAIEKAEAMALELNEEEASLTTAVEELAKEFEV